MSKLIVLGGSLLLAFSLAGQELNEQYAGDFATEVLYAEDVHDKEQLEQYIQHDFSQQLESGNHTTLGYIGSNYRRLYMRLISVIKHPENPKLYLVYGKSKVGSNVCRFQGTMEIAHIREMDNLEYPDKTFGLVLGEYRFFEDQKQKHVGVFEGVFVSYFNLDEAGRPQYEELMSFADGFYNNQFQGLWTKYGEPDPKKANWGDYRIPDSFELDQGAAMFGPAEQYLEYGWENYNNAFLLGQPKAIEKEGETWWIE